MQAVAPRDVGHLLAVALAPWLPGRVAPPVEHLWAWPWPDPSAFQALAAQAPPAPHLPVRIWLLRHPLMAVLVHDRLLVHAPVLVGRPVLPLLRWGLVAERAGLRDLLKERLRLLPLLRVRHRVAVVRA